MATTAVGIGVSLGGQGGIEGLMTELDRVAHPEVSAAPRVLDRALHVLKIAKEEFGLDGMTASELAAALTDRFLLPTTRQAISQAFDRAGGMVHATPSEHGGRRYRLMSGGEAYLADPQAHQDSPSTRRQVPRRRRRGKLSASTSDDGSRVDQETASPRGKRGKAHAGRPGPTEAIAMLVTDGYFTSGRTRAEIQAHLQQKYALTYGSGDLSPTLTRSVRNATLKREQRTVDGQYEYRIP